MRLVGIQRKDPFSDEGQNRSMARSNAQLAINVADVDAYSLLADSQAVSDLGR